jgi:hypothetical protein
MISLNMTILSAIVLGLSLLPLLKRNQDALSVYICFLISFIFWYWIPALNVINNGYLVEDAFASDINLLRYDVLIVLLYYFILIIISVVVAAHWFKRARVSKIVELDDSRVVVASALVVISAAGFLVVQFKNEEAKVIYDLISGAVSARALLTFFNKSSNATSSLIGLWEILTIWCALYLISIHSLRGGLLSVPGSLSVFAIVILFFSSGTRSILVMALFILSITQLIKRRYILHPAARLGRGNKIGFVLLMLFLAFVAFTYKARFENFTNDLTDIVLFSTLTNNDMFSELAFVLSNSLQASNSSIFDFLFTPFSFLFPSFLGFSKNIPSHLIEFNLQRAGIDLLTDEGNVFPGIIADFHMNFGSVGPLVFIMCVTIIIVLLAVASHRIKEPVLRSAFVITFLSYVFISFRNIQGSLVLVLIIGLVFQSFLTTRRFARRSKQ